MKIEARPVYLGNSFTVWIGNYRLLFQGTEEEAERIAAEYRRRMVKNVIETKEGPHEVNLGGSNGNRSALGHGV